jgi:exosome complex exonuclease DIS3/RRP44
MSDDEDSVVGSNDDPIDDEEDENDDNDFGTIDNDWVPIAKIANTTPSLYTRPIYFRQTRKSGKVIMSVNERYIREDLGYGCYFVDDTLNTAESSTSLSANRRKHVDRILGTPKTIDNTQQLISLIQPCKPYSIVVCDTNVLLHNLDVLEQSGSVMPNIIIPQTALHECRSNRVVAYDRAVELIRSVGVFHSTTEQATKLKQRCSIFFPDTYHVATAHVDNSSSRSNEISTNTKKTTINDENDARIRNVAAFFGTNLRGTGIRVILLTDDNECRRIANFPGSNNEYKAYSVREWVLQLEQHNKILSLLDVVSMHDSAVASYKNNRLNDDGDYNDTMHFDAHVDATTLGKGMQSGLYYRGIFRSISTDKAMVTIRQGDERVVVTINSKSDRNRGVDGDVVAVALHPLDKWITTSSAISHEKKKKTKPIVGIAPDTAEPTVSDITNVPESMVLDGSSSWKPTGKVVGIIRRNLPTLSGSIYEVTSKNNSNDREEKTEWEIITETHEREHNDGTTTCVFFAVDKRMPPILVRTSQRHRLLGQRIIVTMDSWPSTSPYPLGHYVRSIGPAGTKDVETQVLLHEHNIPYEPFTAAVLACLPPEDYKIDTDNSPGRTDLRNLPVLSIDPPGCKDIDDALHCIHLPNGNYQVGVHIADVTHYVKAGTPIDLEAAKRSTSTYLVNKRLDMLPSLLTTDLCSLKGNVDRYAFSVLWEVTPDAHIINVDFTKSLIHSIAALTYQQAQTMIEQKDDPQDIQACAVKRLASLARKFRQRRIEAGALTLASPEVKCKFLIFFRLGPLRAV